MTLSHKCLEFEEPIYRYKTRMVDCPMVTANERRQVPTTTPDNMFTLDFSCMVNDQVLCDKVRNVFITAGKFITATLNLKSAVSVKAQFLDFCVNFNDCDTNEVILGAAGPARMIPNQDTDGKIRLYPQALYKQLNLPEHPQFGPNEIQATFNANMTYWFDGDPLPMQFRQADLLYVVLHELIHGLGFINSWNDYMGLQALTPFIAGIMQSNSPIPTPGGPGAPGGAPGGTPGGGIPPTAKGQFVELVFDKNLVFLQNGQSLTSLTDQLNNFQINLNLPDNEVVASFAKSPQFQIAKNVYDNAVVHGTIGFLLTPGDPPNTPLTADQIKNNVFLLETSLNPFVPSSSIGHVDFETYANSSDFLMLFTYPHGLTLNEMMTRSGTTNTYGPIGPNLRTLLGIMGYEVKTDYTPPVTLNGSSDTTNASTTVTFNTTNTTTNNDNHSNSSIVNYNIVLTLFCILLANYFVH
ncbi:hypothetical protein RclHR1_03170009 [Rhizophagus clarus]|uniref:Sequence orphan n=1 Tax=Rhizophagus clarus TaxID=94130 RepID=A0A2Z6R7M2_9GLOM|nr:hypothetical protein RclHR1_03170009 [Rhizophagus clarus]GET00489.1 hypothetical protein GLOIN_2v1550004 [Rhizophagus clarus]